MYKKSALLLLLSSVAFSSVVQAASVEYKTALTCYEDDGDQWYSVGLVPSSAPSKLNLIVVFNDDDFGTKTQLIQAPAVLSTNVQGDSVASNAAGTYVLSYRQTALGIKGSLLMANQAPVQLDCLPNSTLEFDAAIGLEPRLSVGN